MPQQYHAADPALLHAHAPAHYDQPAGGYAPEPHFARRGAPDRLVSKQKSYMHCRKASLRSL